MLNLCKGKTTIHHVTGVMCCTHLLALSSRLTCWTLHWLPGNYNLNFVWRNLTDLHRNLAEVVEPHLTLMG